MKIICANFDNVAESSIKMALESKEGRQSILESVKELLQSKEEEQKRKFKPSQSASSSSYVTPRGAPAYNAQSGLVVYTSGPTYYPGPAYHHPGSVYYQGPVYHHPGSVYTSVQVYNNPVPESMQIDSSKTVGSIKGNWRPSFERSHVNCQVGHKTHGLFHFENNYKVIGQSQHTIYYFIQCT
ncbi:hypothetical protein DFA_03077 [Cavenderia fasciculata]|uniref:Uncharacterized protein n=1 Tax=Cavenderia fasciculata TaxID=261658 RepID=F4PGJ8_CACFS|nr:uncharacterized protein DFA_03077 [Cavenderia fasciculata]EGG24832.1 hypothetical protein DFA_03077 [Cavenderia fasciculata]|eukprot:XP_004362683.1 hypothetical protein DFA_03077 [Cavenderia fasciculata]